MTLTEKLNEIKPAKGSIKNRIRVGRGNSSKGGECGRGHKGQKSRSGYSAKPGFEGGQMPLYKRVPKKRGFNNKFKVYYKAINLSTIDKLFNDNDTVNKETLFEKGLIQKRDKIKILGDGELSKKVTIQASKASKIAEAKIKKAGATLELL